MKLLKHKYLIAGFVAYAGKFLFISIIQNSYAFKHSYYFRDSGPGFGTGFGTGMLAGGLLGYGLGGGWGLGGFGGYGGFGGGLG